MSKPVRLTTEKKQERISRKQFCERMDEFGWIASRPDEDLGEDFIVHIYYQGQATGVTFHVQLKSITNLHQRRKDDFLIYDEIKVKDLKHWEDFSQPVVLVVWDIKLREGRWALVEDIIKELDQRRPKWRGNKSKARVRIPWENTIDDKGLTRLKQAIGRRFYPLISQGRHPDIEIGFQFPDTQGGQTDQTDFINFLKRGGQFTLEGKYVSELNLPDWYEIWFGERDTRNLKFTLEFPIPPQTFLVAVTMIGTNGNTISIPNIELKITEPPGLEAITISNEHQNVPIHFRWTIPQSDEEVFIKVNNLGHDVHTAHNIANFLHVLASGGKLRFTYLTLNNISQDIIVPPQPEKELNPKYLELLDKLCLIQKNIDQFIPILSQEFTGQDVKSIDTLAKIIQRGKTSAYYEEINIDSQWDNALSLILNAQKKNEPVRFTLCYEESHIEFLDLNIPTGPVTHQVTAKPKPSVSELEKIISTIKPHQQLTIQFTDVEIIEIYPDWFIREAERLSQLLIENFEAEAVYLFGSLAWSDIHAPETDIDLAVRGLPPARCLEAIGYLERESDFPVDLVELEKVSNHLRNRILSEGELLSEREPAITPG